jgi:hypothetical protein
MAKLTLVRNTTPVNANLATAAHRASATEGEAARRLLESMGFVLKRKANGQFEFPCPFHEGPGAVERRKSANFYMNATTSEYFCQSAACGERGNLQLLEKHFGIGQDDDYVVSFKDKDTRLKEFERNLTSALRTPFYEHGLTDATIERFRLGFEPEHVETITNDDGSTRSITIPDRYVIPYLEGRRPKFFRYYSPTGDPRWKYTWETGAESMLFNAQDAIGDKDGLVYLCEGEQKAMLLVQMGYAAVAVPGASQWRDEFQAAFTHARKVLIVFDNDNPAFHNYDRPDKGTKCRKCEMKSLPACVGHNPGQEAAVKRLENIGWRAKNIVLPLPDETVKKTDINDFFMRDGFSNADFAELATGKRATPYKVLTFAEITESPPEEAEFLIEQGILSKGGRLLVAGKPKVGKSIFIDNLALSLSAGIPFLKSGSFPGFAVDHPTRTLLLDRELSKWALFKRLTQLSDDRIGYKAAAENLLIDHDHLIRLDQPNAYDTLLGLVEANGAEVVILDTAYKFFGGDVESSSSLMKGFEVLDKIIHETGCSFVLTHHHKKGQGGKGKENTDIADPDNVAGSFLWTGWPNGTILLNYLNRSVENPFNSVATFTAFRDAAPPEPLAMYRSRQSISYASIEAYSHEAEDPSQGSRVNVTKPDADAVEQLMLEMAPITEDEFLHMAAGKFGVTIPTMRPYYIDAMARGNFEKVGRPAIIKYKHEAPEEETWEAEHGLPERPLPKSLQEDDGMGMADVLPFEAAGLVDA